MGKPTIPQPGGRPQPSVLKFLNDPSRLLMLIITLLNYIYFTQLDQTRQRITNTEERLERMNETLQEMPQIISRIQTTQELLIDRLNRDELAIQRLQDDKQR